MMFYLFIISTLLFSINSKEEESDRYCKRLEYRETFDSKMTHYILDSRNNYETIKGLEKSEVYRNSSSYSYGWIDHLKNPRIDLIKFLPPADDLGYRDMTKYDYINLNIYSKTNTGSQFVLLIYCQKRKPDLISSSKVSYKRYTIKINFSGWKEFNIPISSFSDGYFADLKRVSGFYLSAKGWSCIPNKDNEIYINTIYFTKSVTIFNMKESQILDKNYETILKRFKYTFLNSNKLNDKNQNVVKRLKSMVKTASKTRSSMKRDGLPFISPMERSADMNSIYTKIKQMATGYAIEGGELYKNKEFLNDIVYALDYMHEHYYTKRKQKIFTGFDNWWNWDIGIPQALVQILVFIKDELTTEQINKYLSPLNQYIPLPKMTMANRADIAYSCIIAGALQKDYKRIAKSVQMLRECFNYVEKGDGFYQDGSFIQHTVYGYIGGYGSALINAFSRISYSLEFTCFRLDSEMIESQFNWLYFNFIPFLYKGAFFDLVRGRGVSRNIKGQSTGLATINSIFFSLKYIKNEKSLNYLKNYLKDLYLNNKNFYDSSLSVGALSILDELMLEDIPLVNINYNFARVYPKTDKAIAQVNGVGIGISLSSTRQGKYESINQENMKGWYQGDGMTYVYISPNDYASLFYQNVNPYRLPGTTVTTSPREPSSLSGQKALAKFDFVGGTFNEQSMVAAMALNGSSPGANFTSSLIGYKAYFFSENILVCTGVNISCNDNYNVETIIENRKINGKFYFGDKEITDKSGKITSSYIYIENYGGIYIPDYKNARFNLTDKGFLEIYLEHGKKIKNHSYKYYILPKIEKSNFENLVKDVEIVYNNDKLSAVVFKSKKIVELVFWQKGNFNNLVVDNPCTILINNKPELYISDPTQKIGKINLSLEAKTKTANLKDGNSVRLFSSSNDIKSSWLENLFKHNK